MSDMESVVFRAPIGLKAAVRKLARRDYRSPSETLRQIVIRSLREEGVAIEPIDQNGASEAVVEAAE